MIGSEQIILKLLKLFVMQGVELLIEGLKHVKWLGEL
jgi:hypothetical protein